MTDSKSRCVVEISTDTRPIVFLTIDRLSTDCRPTIDRYIDRLSTDCRPSIDGLSTDYRPIVDRVSTDCRPSIDRLSTAMSTAISTAISTDTSVDITHSKQDPTFFGSSRNPPSCVTRVRTKTTYLIGGFHCHAIKNTGKPLIQKV